MRSSVSFIAIVVALGVASSAFAHAPTAIDASFDLEEHLLRVVVSHDTKDGSKHFVNLIEVKLNGKDIIEQKFAAQQDKSIQEVLYRITDVKIGDEIEITAGCNIAGKKKTSLAVKKPEPPKKEPEQEN